MQQKLCCYVTQHRPTGITIIAVLMIIGGVSDLTNNRYILSKENYWKYGLYLLILAIFLEIAY